MDKIGHRMHIVVTLILVVLITVPLIPLAMSSISAGWLWPEIIPHTFSIRAWHYVLSQESGTWGAVWTSLEIAVSVTFINLALAIPAADALARWKFRGKLAVQVILFAPIVVPPFVAMMGMYITFIRLNLTESILGVILAHIVPTLPYMIRALIVSFSTLGFQLEEQARMLGAGRYKRLWYVCCRTFCRELWPGQV